MSNSPNQPPSRDNRNGRLDDASHTNPFGEHPIPDPESPASDADTSLEAPESAAPHTPITHDTPKKDIFAPRKELKEDDAFSGYVEENEPTASQDAPASPSAHSADTSPASPTSSASTASDAPRVPGRHRLILPDTNPAYYPPDEASDTLGDEGPRDDEYAASHRRTQDHQPAHHDSSSAAEPNADSTNYPEDAPTVIHHNGTADTPQQAAGTQQSQSPEENTTNAQPAAAGASAVSASRRKPKRKKSQAKPSTDGETNGPKSQSLLRRIFGAPFFALLFVIIVLGGCAFLGMFLMRDQQSYDSYSSDLKVLSSTSPVPPGERPLTEPDSELEPSQRPGVTIKGKVGDSLTLEGQRVRICDIDDGDFTRAAGPDGLACPFVKEVREEYNNAASDKRSKLKVTSPVSGRDFTLTCSEVKPDLVKCRGNGTTMTVYLGN